MSKSHERRRARSARTPAWQRHLQDAILGDDGRVRAALDEIVATSPADARRRLEIHRRMFRIRTSEVLEGAYPRLRTLLGARPFEHLVERYLAVFPPCSFTLDRLGARLARFLERHAGDLVVLGPWRNAPGLLADLARVEWAVERTRTAATQPPLDPRAWNATTPEDLEALRFAPRHAVVPVALRHAPHALLETPAERFASIPPTRRRPYVLSWRGGEPHLEPTTFLAHHLARQLRRGRRLGDALVAACAGRSELAPRHIQAAMHAAAPLLAPRRHASTPDGRSDAVPPTTR